MGRTLEEWFAELDRLLEARDGEAATWTLRRTNGSAVGVSDIHEGMIGTGSTPLEAIENACGTILHSAQRVMRTK